MKEIRYLYNPINFIVHYQRNIFFPGINTLATLVQATENADDSSDSSTENFKDVWTTPHENTVEASVIS